MSNGPSNVVPLTPVLDRAVAALAEGGATPPDDIGGSTPPVAAQVPLVEIPDVTMESPIQVMFDASRAKNPTATGMRVFGFDKEHITLVFCGPEAEVLAMQMINYTQALVDELTGKVQRAVKRTGGKIITPD